MAKIVELRAGEYSDAACVKGIKEENPHVMEYFFVKCKNYFDEHYRGVFFVQEYDKDDIFQNTYITLWENIEHGKIYVKDGELYGRNNERFSGSLMTYMMGIGKLKYKEWVRGKMREPNFDDWVTDENGKTMEPADTTEWLNDDEQLAMLEAISESLSVMSKGCYEILTKFYDEGKTLDMIMEEMPNYKSKNALKSNKNRCLDVLRNSSKSLYEMRGNL